MKLLDKNQRKLLNFYWMMLIMVKLLVVLLEIAIVLILVIMLKFGTPIMTNIDGSQ